MRVPRLCRSADLNEKDSFAYWSALIILIPELKRIL